MNAESLLAEYSRWVLQDSAAPNTTQELNDTVRQSILEEPELHSALHSDAFSLITSGLQNRTDLLSALTQLAGAFQTLEQAALQLYLTPWRKELHTIKMYTGHYVYVLETALPQDAIFVTLKKLGYEPQESEACLTIRILPPPRTLLAAAFGFRAAQLECRILSDIVLSLGPTLGSGADLIQERRSWRGASVCMERLRKLTLEARSAAFSLPSVDIYGSDGKDLDGEPELYQAPSCGTCHKPWGQHVNGCCNGVSEYMESMHPPAQDSAGSIEGQHVDYAMHDCVFFHKSLALRCVQCHAFHSSNCPSVSGCRDMGHQVTQLTPPEKLGAVVEEQGKKHQLHYCLQQGHLPHYRCAHCRQLHYIKCEKLLECRLRGHNATMIMLEKDQRLWLQRSLMDITELCNDGAV